MAAQKVTDLERRFAEMLRKELNIREHGAQALLAEKVGVSRSRMNNIVQGRRGSTEEVRRKICDELGVDYDSFVLDKSQTQKVGTAGGPVIQTIGNGAATINGGNGSALNEKERELIELLRRYGGAGSIDSIIAKLKQVQDMFK